MNIRVLVLSLLVCSLSANQICMRPQQKTVAQYQNDDVQESHQRDQDLVDFDVDDSTINVDNLVPKWARLANQVASRFFIWYNNIYKWWYAKNDARLKSR